MELEDIIVIIVIVGLAQKEDQINFKNLFLKSMFIKDKH